MVIHAVMNAHNIKELAESFNVKLARASGKQGKLTNLAIEVWAPTCPVANMVVTPVVGNDDIIHYLYL